MRNNESDAVIITSENRSRAKENQLIPIMNEYIDDHDLIIVRKDLKEDLLTETPM